MRDLARRLSGSPEIGIESERWPALFTHRVLLDLEDLTGLDVLNGGLDLSRPRASDLRAVVYLLAKQGGASFSQAEIGAMCKPRQMAQWRRDIFTGWRASMPDSKPSVAGSAKGDPQTWMEAWAIGHEVLRLEVDEWRDMTPRMADALMAQHLEGMRQRELMLSRIAAAVANFGMSAPKSPIPEDAFMLHPWPKADVSEGVTGEDLMRVFSGMRATKEKRVA